MNEEMLWILAVVLIVALGCAGCARRCPPPVAAGVFPERCHGKGDESHVAIIVPGLNNSGASFNQLTAELCTMGASPYVVDVELVDDSDVEARVWRERVRVAVDGARAEHPGARVSLMGYSLGANLALMYAAEHNDAVSNLILIAPAIALPFRARILLALGALSPLNLKVPSLAPCGYRIRDYTDLASYRALSQSRQYICELASRSDLKLPATVIFARESDSLISFRGTKDWADRLGGGTSFVRVSSEGDATLDSHLLVDERSFGESGWREFLASLRKIFAASAPS